MANKTKKYGLWREEDMERAIDSYSNGDMGLNAICRTYGVPKKTLKRRMEGKNIYATDSKKHFGRPQDLPFELENQLVQHALDLEKMFFGLTREDLKKLAFDIAEVNSIPHRFNNDKKMAGDKWYYSFISRHPELSLRKPEATSMARATGFTKERTDEFFDVLTRLVDENKFQAADIFNVDETALSTVQRPRKIIAQKGKNQVGSMTSMERGSLTTGIFCMSAAGVYVPPMLVFKGLRFKPEWKIGAPPGTTFDMSESGWSNSDVFLNWLKSFVSFIKPNKEKKVLLILDGHCSHTKNLFVINYARENGVIMLSLPSHTSHKLQPLDVSFFGPLKSNFNLACERYIRTHLTKISVSHVSLLLNESYPKTAVVATAINGFRATGIWPIDRDTFKESDYAIPPNMCVSDNLSVDNASISTSQMAENKFEHVSKDPTTPNVLKSVKDISPLPDVSKMLVKKRNSTSGPVVEVLTSTPYKDKLIQKANKKKDKPQKKEHRVNKKRSLKKDSAKKSVTIIKRKINFDFREENNQDCNEKDDETTKKRMRLVESSWFCSICCTEKPEDMIQCLKCYQWFHVVCANVKPSRKIFYCILCKY
jgi:hypothetical protein